MTRRPTAPCRRTACGRSRRGDRRGRGPHGTAAQRMPREGADGDADRAQRQHGRGQTPAGGCRPRDRMRLGEATGMSGGMSGGRRGGRTVFGQDGHGGMDNEIARFNGLAQRS
ncbi:hypothetical protein Ddc_20177 [Ditylenchus destructor]|nr:hypothetical protein Ddc_20177 [Ditylenchus destructor]